MMKNKNHIEQWFSSKEIKAKLGITDCQLMHLRVSGKLKFKKQGNSFLYLLANNKNDE